MLLGGLRKNKGFTLIELVVVIAILGILAGIAIPRFMHSSEAARGAKLVGDLRTIDSAITLYATRTGSYPASLSNLIKDDPGAAPPSLALLAAEPIPPAGSFIVMQSTGIEKEFSAASAIAYVISDGRATFNGTSYTVDYYLGSISVISDYMLQIVEALKKLGSSSNSYAAAISGSNTAQTEAALAAEGIDLASLGVIIAVAGATLI